MSIELTDAERVEALLAEHDDMWFNGAQPPNDRDFGCICDMRVVLGHTPEDDYEVIHRRHVAEVLAAAVAARVASALAPIEALAADLHEQAEAIVNRDHISQQRKAMLRNRERELRAALSSHQDPTNQPEMPDPCECGETYPCRETSVCRVRYRAAQPETEGE